MNKCTAEWVNCNSIDQKDWEMCHKAKDMPTTCWTLTHDFRSNAFLWKFSHQPSTNHSNLNFRAFDLDSARQWVSVDDPIGAQLSLKARLQTEIKATWSIHELLKLGSSPSCSWLIRFFVATTTNQTEPSAPINRGRLHESVRSNYNATISSQIDIKNMPSPYILVLCKGI